VVKSTEGEKQACANALRARGWEDEKKAPEQMGSAESRKSSRPVLNVVRGGGGEEGRPCQKKKKKKKKKKREFGASEGETSGKKDGKDH